MTYISKHISFAEATRTSTGLPNIPNAEQVANMQHVAQKVFDRVRENFKKPIAVNSFFRSHAVNRAVKGAATSQHTAGEAIDMDGRKYGVSNAEIFGHIKDNLDFDQLIWEFGDNQEPAWVHVSLKIGLNRRQVLKATKASTGRTVYTPMR